VPDKYRVLGADGKLDVAETLRKTDEARSELEKRMGSGGARPKTADDYKLEGEQFAKLGLDAAATAEFRKEAHELALSQKQFEGVMARYAKLAPELVGASQQQDTAAVVEDLGKLWGAESKANMQAAWRAGESIAAKLGIPMAEVDAALGNNPVAIRMLHALSKEMGEDASPAPAGGSPSSGRDLQSYLSQGDNWAAYTDAKHMRHAEVSAQARKITEASTKT
jgi:hypothetical protein